MDWKFLSAMAVGVGTMTMLFCYMAHERTLFLINGILVGLNLFMYFRHKGADDDSI